MNTIARNEERARNGKDEGRARRKECQEGRKGNNEGRARMKEGQEGRKGGRANH